MNSNWEKAVDESIINSSREIATLDQDVSARFNGLNAVVQSLGDQVSDLAEYVGQVPETRVVFVQNSGWGTPNTWTTMVSANIVIPYPCYVSVYAAAHNYILSQKISGTNDDQFANGRARIRIVGVNSSPENSGAIYGPDGNERLGFGITHAAQYRSNGGTLSVVYEIINGNNANSAGTDAGLAVIATFVKAM